MFTVAQSCTLSVSPEIVAAREDFFNYGWTRINTDEDGRSPIRVYPCSSVVGSYWLWLRRAAQYRRFVICFASQRANAWDRSDTLPNIIRRYGRLKICATTRATGLNRCVAGRKRRVAVLPKATFQALDNDETRMRNDKAIPNAKCRRNATLLTHSAVKGATVKRRKRRAPMPTTCECTVG